MSMENLIVVAAVAAWLGGTLILLTCLAARRAELVQAYNIEEAAKRHGSEVEEGVGQASAAHAMPDAGEGAVGGDGGEDEGYG